MGTAMTTQTKLLQMVALAALFAAANSSYLNSNQVDALEKKLVASRTEIERLQAKNAALRDRLTMNNHQAEGFEGMLDNAGTTSDHTADKKDKSGRTSRLEKISSVITPTDLSDEKFQQILSSVVTVAGDVPTWQITGNGFAGKEWGIGPEVSCPCSDGGIVLTKEQGSGGSWARSMRLVSPRAW